MDCQLALGQWTDDGFGNIYCDPALPPQSISIGDGTTVNLATLNVRGDQLPVNDAFGTSLCTFRSDVDEDFNQNWSMVRAGLEIGRLWHTNPALPFHIQSTAAPDYVTNRGSGLYLQNNDGDGVKISHNGPLFSGNTLNGYAVHRQGYVALGSSAQ